MIRPKRARAGVAIGIHRVVALHEGATEPVTVELPRDAAPGLREAVEEVARQLPAGPMDLHVVLLPPLATARHLDLPPLRSRDLSVILRTGARRFFPSSGPLTIGAAGGRGLRTPARPLAMAAPEDIVQTVFDAALPPGKRLASVRGALGAWAGAARDAVPGAPETAAAIACDRQTIVISCGDRGVERVRRAPGRVRALDDLLPAMPAPVDNAPCCVTIGMSDACASGWHVVELSDEADVTAARYAPEAGGPSLIPEAVRRTTVARTRIWARRLAAASLIVVALAAVLEAAGLHYRLSRLRSGRAALRAAVAPVLATRDTLDTLGERLARLESLDSGSVRWTDALFDLAMLLPRDAWISQLGVDADSMVIRGTAGSAAHAMEALRNGAAIVQPQFSGAIQRELRDEAAPLEHFRLVARIAPSASR